MANQVATLLQPIIFSIRSAPLPSHQLKVTILLLCLFVRSNSTHYSIVGPYHRVSNTRRCDSEQLGENEHEIFRVSFNNHRNFVIILTPQKFGWGEPIGGGGAWPSQAPMEATAGPNRIFLEGTFFRAIS